MSEVMWYGRFRPREPAQGCAPDRARGAGLGSKERAEVDGQHVAFDDLNIRVEGELHAELGKPVPGRVRWQ